jgi:hypothetical protein
VTNLSTGGLTIGDEITLGQNYMELYGLAFALQEALIFPDLTSLGKISRVPDTLVIPISQNPKEIPHMALVSKNSLL